MRAKTTTARSNNPPVLVGYGFDLHNVSTRRGLTLGGVFFAEERALVAHSDGDIVLHAVANAVLGALGKGDIGAYFSDRDVANKGLDSRRILDLALAMMRKDDYRIGNIDVQLVAQDLMIAPLREKLLASLRKLLDTPRVNIKGTRWEKKSSQVGCHVVLTLLRG